ncbi:MAG: hypothetical protein ACOYPR_15880 [Saprospiraceae bacterium]
MSAWEQFIDSRSNHNSVVLIAKLLHLPSAEPILQWTIEQRDRELFNLRIQMFGQEFQSICSCPSCGFRMEWKFDVNEINLDKLPDIPPANRFDVVVNDYKLHCRLPVVNDLFSQNHENLFWECLLSVFFANAPVASKTINPEIQQMIHQEVERLCPVSSLSFQFVCHECSKPWEEPFDISDYLIKEINQWAASILLEVSLLARAFGWPETTIVNMSQKKRSHYLSLIQET